MSTMRQRGFGHATTNVAECINHAALAIAPSSNRTGIKTYR